MFTKAEATAMMRDMLDDPSSKRWGATQLENFATAVIDGMWRRILQLKPEYLVATETVAAPAAPGYIDLDTDLTYRFHGVRAITRDEQQYGEADARRIVLEGGEDVVYDSHTWVKLGSQIHLFPYGTDPVEIRYSYIPQGFNLLADGEDVIWPEGHELAYILRVPGLLMLKGATEDSSLLLREATQAWHDMLETLPGQSPGGTQMYVNDTPEGWGG